MQVPILDTNLEILEEIYTNRGHNLRDMSFRNPLMVIFLRHFGCVFCKEAMHDISVKRKGFEAQGFRIVFVHMSDDQTAADYFSRFNLSDIDFISDAEQNYYRSFGLLRGSFNQLYGLQTWIRGYKIKKQFDYDVELAKKLGDSTQMPGVFILMDGQIKESFIHRHAAERPDYERLLKCCVS